MPSDTMLLSVSDLSTFFQRHNRALALTAGPLAVLIAAQAIHNNYLRWRNLAPGGLPHNVFGWLVNWLVWPLGITDMTSVRPFLQPRYLKPFGDVSTKKFLKEPLPWREPFGGRPYVDPNCSAPQRQESQTNLMPPTAKEKQSNLLQLLLITNEKSLRIGTSNQEKRGPAIWLAEHLTVPSWAKRTHGEIAHIHIDADGSGHCSMSPADAMEVVEKGWGQRHRLSHWINIGFVMVYAPRNEEEVEVMRTIFGAAVDAFLDGAEEKAA